MDNYRKIHLIWALLIFAAGYFVNQPLRDFVMEQKIQDLGLTQAGQAGFLFVGTFLLMRFFHPNLLPVKKAFAFHVCLMVAIELSPLLMGNGLDGWRVLYLFTGVILVKYIYLPFWNKMENLQKSHSGYL